MEEVQKVVELPTFSQQPRLHGVLSGTSPAREGPLSTGVWFLVFGSE